MGCGGVGWWHPPHHLRLLLKLLLLLQGEVGRVARCFAAPRLEGVPRSPVWGSHNEPALHPGRDSLKHAPSLKPVRMSDMCDGRVARADLHVAQCACRASAALLPDHWHVAIADRGYRAIVIKWMGSRPDEQQAVPMQAPLRYHAS